jgi:hypothetical protein
MKITRKSVNEKGLVEIQNFLRKNHKLGGDHFDKEMLLAWAEQAEFQLAEGNPASIEIRSWDSVNGATVNFEISDEGVSSEQSDDGEEDES